MYKLDELTERERDAAWVDSLETAEQFQVEAASCLDGQIYGAPVAWEIAFCLAQQELQRPKEWIGKDHRFNTHLNLLDYALPKGSCSDENSL